MVKKKGPITKEDLMFLGSVIIVFIIPILIPQIISPSTSVLHWSLYIYITIGILAAAFTGLWQIRSVRGALSNREELLTPRFIPQAVDLALQLTIKDVLLQRAQTKQRNETKPNKKLRANLMQIDSSNNLYITNHVNMNNPDEITLKWPRGHGCCGISWEDGRQYVINPTIRPEKGQLDWRRFPTPVHEKLTKHLKSICSTPIFHPQTKNIIGILNLDSTEPLTVTEFDTPVVYKELQAKAMLIAPLLVRD